MSNKTLVAYFSATGTTARAARRLAEAVGADLYEIRPAVPYTRADLNWNNSHSRSSLEMNDPASRPELAGARPDVSAYEQIYLGFPIWWYTAPRLISTFLESCELGGKTIILFATSGGSGLGGVARDLAPCCPGADIRDGRLLNGRQSVNDLKNWISKL